jgi:hypothetical protein
VACIGPALIGAATSVPPVSSALDRRPITFEPNHGQGESGALFVGRNRNYTVSLHRHEVVFGTQDAPRLKLRLVGGREPSKIEGLSPTGGTSSYFAGNRPSRCIPTFRISVVFVMKESTKESIWSSGVRVGIWSTTLSFLQAPIHPASK